MVDYIKSGEWLDLSSIDNELRPMQPWLNCIHIPHTQGVDEVFWNFSSFGKFKVANAYKFISRSFSPPIGWVSGTSSLFVKLTYSSDCLRRERSLPSIIFVEEVFLSLTDVFSVKRWRKILVIFCCFAPIPKMSRITSLTFGILPRSSLFLLSECGLNGNALLVIRP